VAVGVEVWVGTGVNVGATYSVAVGWGSIEFTVEQANVTARIAVSANVRLRVPIHMGRIIVYANGLK
jgi:hypothetical protein